MARKAANLESASTPVRGATLHPLRVIKRELVSPSGTVVEVDVPVYPPFRLETDEERAANGRESARSRSSKRRREDAEEE